MNRTNQQNAAVIGCATGGSYGYDYDFPEIELPEIVVTPDGVYKGEGWDDFSGWDNDDDTDPYGLGGGSYSENGDNMTQAEIEANGRQAVSLFADSIFNQTAIWLKEFSETKTFHTIEATNLVANAPGFQEDLIKALSSNQGILNTWGKAFVRGNAIAGEVVAIIGLFDGDKPQLGDFVNIVGATLGIFAAYGSFACPAVGLTLSGISLVCTLVGNYMNSRDESSY